jgi:hypothetical protein
VVSHKKNEIFTFSLIKIQFIAGQAGKTVLIKDYLGRKIDGMDLTDLLGTQHVDHVLGNKLADLTDSGEPFNKNRVDKFPFPNGIKKAD